MALKIGDLMHEDTVPETVSGQDFGSGDLHVDKVAARGPVAGQLTTTTNKLPIAGAVTNQADAVVTIGNTGISIHTELFAATKEKYGDLIAEGRNAAQVMAQGAVNRAQNLIDPVLVAKKFGVFGGEENVYKPPFGAPSFPVEGAVQSAAIRTASEVIPQALDMQTMTLPAEMPLVGPGAAAAIEAAEKTRGKLLASLFKGKSPIVLFDDPLIESKRNPKAWHKNQRGDDDDIRGYFRHRNNDPFSLPSDDDVYMPFAFTDLRKIGPDEFRTVYFRPYISSFSEDFAPDWNAQNFFGRVDPVSNYQATGRTITVGFKVVAETPEELLINYRKLTWLQSMVYPYYDQGLHFKSGPVIKLRLGDLFSAVGRDGVRGLPGYLTSINLDYGSATWELRDGARLPREIDLNVSMQVLHEYPIGLIGTATAADYAGAFGGIDINGGSVDVSRFRRMFGDGDYINPTTATAKDPY